MLSPEHSEINELPYNLKIFYRINFENTTNDGNYQIKISSLDLLSMPSY